MIIIKSIAIGKDVRIGFVKSGNIVPQAMTLRSIEIGRPKLYQAMDAVFAALEEAEQYIVGNRAQMKLDFQRADNHDE